MQVIAAVNNKGGVGKTKITELLTEFMCRFVVKPSGEKLRVLAIDFDPQCNLSQKFLSMDIDPVDKEGIIPPIHPDFDPVADSDDWDGRSSIADIFFKQEQGVIPYPTYLENLDIAPGNARQLLAAEAVRRNEVVEKVHAHLRTFLACSDVQETYDVVIIDTQPSKGPLTVSVIKAATHILIPTIMEEKPIQGLFGMIQLWMQESLQRDKDNPLNLIGVLPNKFKQVSLHKELKENLERHESIGKYIMPVKLGDRIALAEVDSQDASPKSIFDLSNKEEAKKEAVEMCSYVIKKVFPDVTIQL